MNRENFIVRKHLETVDRFRERTVWARISDAARARLQRDVAGPPSEIATDDIAPQV